MPHPPPAVENIVLFQPESQGITTEFQIALFEVHLELSTNPQGGINNLSTLPGHRKGVGNVVCLVPWYQY